MRNDIIALNERSAIKAGISELTDIAFLNVALGQIPIQVGFATVKHLS
jgi:hypothetical protein